MSDAMKKVRLTDLQRTLVDRIEACRAAGNPTVIERDEMGAFLSPGVAAVLDGTAVPDDAERGPTLYLVEGHSAAMGRGILSTTGKAASPRA